MLYLATMSNVLGNLWSPSVSDAILQIDAKIQMGEIDGQAQKRRAHQPSSAPLSFAPCPINSPTNAVHLLSSTAAAS